MDTRGSNGAKDVCDGHILEFGGGYGTWVWWIDGGGSCGLNHLDHGSICAGPDWVETVVVTSKEPVAYV